MIAQGEWDPEMKREWKVTLGASVLAFCGVSALNYRVSPVSRLSSQLSHILHLLFNFLIACF